MTWHFSCRFQYSFFVLYLDILTVLRCERVISLVLSFWICIYFPRFGEISAIMLLNKFFYAFSFLTKIKCLTFYSCILKILWVLPKNTPNTPTPSSPSNHPLFSHYLTFACNSFPTHMFAFILEINSSYNRQRNPFEKCIPSNDRLCT